MKPILFLFAPLLLIIFSASPAFAFDLPFCPMGGPPGWYDRMFGQRQIYAPPPFPPNQYFAPIMPVHAPYPPTPMQRLTPLAPALPKK
ncbi:MAG: hypothetical protein DSZ28_00350 [Thiothrix sp.]|nr:MAG: hypothetical protein DSZ28_00350 [Thiothrix sp.]